MGDLQYYLAESVVSVVGTIERVQDEYVEFDALEYESADIDVVLLTRGDEGGGLRSLAMDTLGDDELTIQLRDDNRLASVVHKSSGVGGRVVTAGGTLIASILGVAIRYRGGRPALNFIDVPQGGAEPTPEDDWASDHKREARLRAAYRELVGKASDELLTARQRLVAATTFEEQSQAGVRISRLASVLRDSQVELDRIETLYKLWRESKRTRRTERLAYMLSMQVLPAHVRDIPDPGTLTGPSKEIWEELGVLVEVGPAEGRATLPAGVHQPEVGDARMESRRVRWRESRPAQLWVWRRPDQGGGPVLERTSLVQIVDERCDTRALELHGRFFGEQGGEIQFNDIGSPTKIVRNDKSALGAFADAIGGLPSAVASGLDSAVKIGTSLDTLKSAEDERALSSLKRRIEMRQQELNKKGLEASADDFAEMKRLEQQVAMHDARGTLATPLALTSLQAERDMIKAQQELEAARRDLALDAELAAARAEIARLQAEVDKAELRQKAGEGA